MFISLILSIFLSTPDACEPPVDATPVDACGAPLCVYNDGVNPPTTKNCDNSCSWIPGSVITCGEWTCSPLTPASACRWSCILS